MNNNGCQDLANSIRALQNLADPNERKEIARSLTNIQCVSCNNTAEFNNLTAGGDIEIGDLNQIISCGIGNSGSTELVAQLKNFIDEKTVSLNNDFNIKIIDSNRKTNQTLNNFFSSINLDLQYIITGFGLTAGILFLMILIIIILKLLNI